MADTARRQFLRYTFYKLDRSWRLLPEAERMAHKHEFAAAVDAMSKSILTRTYTLTGLRGDCDFLIWSVNRDLDAVQENFVSLSKTKLGAYLDIPHSFLATTRHSMYFDPTTTPETQPPPVTRTVRAGMSKYLFVYPFIKNRDWYMTPKAERQEMMENHITIGRKYPGVRINTGYSYGLDDQEFVVAFDADDPHEFLDLVMELRETKASKYTVRDTPSFTCRAASIGDILDNLG